MDSDPRSPLPEFGLTGPRLIAIGNTEISSKLTAASFFSNRTDLGHVDFELLQRRDFKRDDDDPGKLERYQAEALAHRYIPVEALVGIGCYTDEARREVENSMSGRSQSPIRTRPDWYF